MDQFWPRESGVFLSDPPTPLDSLRPVRINVLLIRGSRSSYTPSWGGPHALELCNLAYAMLPDCEHTKPYQHWDFGVPDRSELLCGFTPLPSLELPRIRDAQIKSGGLTEGYYTLAAFVLLRRL